MTEIRTMTEDCASYGQSQVFDTENNDEDIPAPVQKSRRRSSFFAEARRKSLGNISLNDSCDSFSTKRTELDAYRDLLEKEEKEWKDVLNRRKDEYQETERTYIQFCNKRHVMTEEEGMSLLDEDQKRYLSNLPNFSYIESRCNYKSNLVMLLENQELTNKITLMKVLERAEDKVEACKAKIQCVSRKEN